MEAEAAAAQMEKHSSAAAFVEGGVQDACDDDCSICLEAFSDSDPSAVTSCRHEFHLKCILEWCQRSSQCPMCWQAISMTDPMSQELLEAVEEERNAQENHARTTTIFCHPLLGDIVVPVDADDSEIEERIIQHCASLSSHPRQEGDHEHASAVISSQPLPSVDSTEETAPASSVNDTSSVDGAVGSNDSISRNQSSSVNQDEAGLSDAQSFSEKIKSRVK